MILIHCSCEARELYVACGMCHTWGTVGRCQRCLQKDLLQPRAKPVMFTMRSHASCSPLFRTLTPWAFSIVCESWIRMFWEIQGLMVALAHCVGLLRTHTVALEGKRLFCKANVCAGTRAAFCEGLFFGRSSIRWHRPGLQKCSGWRVLWLPSCVARNTG